MNITKETPLEYLKYLANHCRKEIADFSSRKIDNREQGKHYNEKINYYLDILEKINKAELKTDIRGTI